MKLEANHIISNQFSSTVGDCPAAELMCCPVERDTIFYASEPRRHLLHKPKRSESTPTAVPFSKLSKNNSKFPPTCINASAKYFLYIQ